MQVTYEDAYDIPQHVYGTDRKRINILRNFNQRPMGHNAHPNVQL